MNRFEPWSLRYRLIILVLIATVPALGLILYDAWGDRRAQTQEVERSVQRIARFFVNEQRHILESARQLLVALAQLREVRQRNPRACSALFAELEAQYPVYVNFGAVDPDGTRFCSSVSSRGPADISGHPYFKRVLETRDFSVGEYHFSRSTGKATLTFGYPVLSGKGSVQAVVFAALDLGWLNNRIADLSPPQTVVILLDNQGTILARDPEAERWVGESVPETPLFKAVAARAQGNLEVAGVDGVQRLFAFATLSESKQAGNLYLAVGIPKEPAIAQVDRVMFRNLAWLALVALLGLAAAWLIGNQLIVNFITERERLREETEQVKADFTAMIAHDLRSPLMTVVSATDVLKDGLVGQVNDEQKKWLDRIQAQSDNMVNLIGDFLDLSKLESGRIELIRENVDLKETIGNSIDNFLVLAAEKKLSLKSRVDPSLACIAADPRRLNQVFGNLISNAIKFTPAGGNVEVGASRQNGVGVKLWVKDNGVGISNLEIGQLFEKYRQTTSGKISSQQGTGLGLVICKMIVEAHGGKIWAESEESNGTTFFFTLPRN